jgi:hypothetical protein
VRSDVRRSLEHVRYVVGDLGRLLDEMRFSELAELLRAVDRPREGVIQQWTTLRDDVVRALRGSWPSREKREVVEGVGVLEKVTTSSTVTWDGERVAYVVAAQVADDAVDRETGEIKPPGVIAHEVASALIECAGLDAGSKQWRKGALRERGIDPDSFSERRGGRPGVRLE